MADWSDPQATAAPYAGAQADVRDAGLRSHMLSVYNYMASGVLLTGIVSLMFAKSGYIGILFNEAGTGFGPLGWVVMLAPLAIVFAMSFGAARMATATLQLLYWAYAFLMGLSLSTIFLVYTGTSIAQVFFATAAGFAGLSLWGYTTKRDLSAFGTFFTMGLFGLIAAMLINLFLRSEGLSFVISAAGVLIFAGLTAYDTQKIKSLYFQVAGSDMQGKAVILGALTLYLDFINMFLFLLRLFGSSRN
ncbi:MAG: Bax inhibitor-1/YccA family protein [Sphingomonas sp.]|uniref:Bax inhibitor-1/YccA family protein n=1 Tax=Sphingomonas sp. TaxID=28214 RepID=UPI0025FAF479|nr:Bax inhibitor-1/YccA family protein [Sphingomonas sp.]MBX3566075.1 Bax inhibitor-1/YccA family protein [Sphingomonas sp.]